MWEEIIKVLGLAGFLIAAVAWLINKLTKHFLDQNIEIHKKTLELEHEKNSITYREKIELYKEISTPIIKLIVAIEHEQKMSQEFITNFEEERLIITAQLSMFAPQYVFDSYNNLIDYLYNSSEGKEQYTFQQFREFAMKFLSDIRKDIGVYTDEIIYNGNR